MSEKGPTTVSEKKTTDYESSRVIWQRKIIRIYLSGMVALAVLGLLWYALKQLSPWFDQFDNPLVGIVISIGVLLLIPPILGVIIQYAINPLLGNWNTWNELVRLEQQIVDGISDEFEYKVVIVGWPSEKVKSIGLMTRRYPATKDSPEMGAVFIPSGARGKSGNMRIVAVEDLAYLSWTFREFQVYQFTMGAISPENLRR